MLKEALNLITEKESKKPSMKMRRIDEEQTRGVSSNSRGKRTPALQLQAVIRGLEEMLADMKSHMKDEEKEEAEMLKKGIKHNQMMFLYYEQQADSLAGFINQLKTIAGTMPSTVKESVNEGFSPTEISKITKSLETGKSVPENLMKKIEDFCVNNVKNDMPQGTRKARTGDPEQWTVDWVYDELAEIATKSGAPGVQKALS